VTFFASWFAWAPISCLFLGKIAIGYTVRRFILVNLILPAFFGILWFSVFSSTSIFYDQLSNVALYAVFQESGLSPVVYSLFEYLTRSLVTTLLFLGVNIIIFVTATDSNTHEIADLCSQQVGTQGHTDNHWVKVFWALSIGLNAWLSTNFLGDDGIKMLSHIAGLPGMIIVDISTISWLILVYKLKQQSSSVLQTKV
jgi:choline-glycine betaine transporter